MEIRMSESEQIIYMQTRLIRLASEEWRQPIGQVADFFAENGVLKYIAECFGIFHVEGDAAILEDIERYLRNKGVM